MRKTLVAIGVAFFSFSNVYANDGLIKLDDNALSEVEGAALLNLTYTDPANANAEMKSQNVGFYKLGLDAEMDLNANIESLKLGCGGDNGAGACDIDINYLSLSGMGDTREARAGSSAKMTNPFIEIAIKNPEQTSTREVVGFRLSAEKVYGLLTAGLENSGTPSGINTFSGYMKIQSGVGNTAAEQSKIKGYASTEAAYLDLSEHAINGRLKAKALGLSLATVEFKTIGGGFNIPSMNNLPFETDSIIINGNRKTSANLTATVNIPTIHLGDYAQSGVVTSNPNDPYNTTTGVYTAGTPVDAQITSCGPFLNPACLVALPGTKFSSIKMYGSVQGAQAQVNFTEALGYVHKLAINSPFSLSLQKQAIRWPGATSDNIAQKGWWLAVTDPVSIGEIMPTQKLSINPLLPQFAQQASTFLANNPAETTDIAGILSRYQLDVNVGTIRPTDKLSMNLQNLQLKGQDFAPNCYGNLKFC